MGGRRLTQYNTDAPACVDAMAQQKPLCFNTTEQWRNYLLDCWRGALDIPAERSRMVRLERPDYCSDCEYHYHQRMLEQDRCHPPEGAIVPTQGGNRG